MHFKFFGLAGLASLVAAQDTSNQTLAQALNSSSDLSSLSNLINQNPTIVAALSNATNITILAPNNDALSTFLSSSNLTSNTSTDVQALLQYHVLSGTYLNFTDTPTFVPTLLQPPTDTEVTGGQVVEVVNTTVFSGLRTNSSIVSSAPVNFTGGVVHIIDTVLTLPASIADTALPYNLTSFYGAVTNASLVDTVDGASDVTVFIPNNDAFQAIGSALSNLTMDNITSILSYHVVNGTVAYSSLLSNESVQTLEGSNVTITVTDSDVFVNNALVVIPDILVANGVVHVIDEVLNPANSTAASGGASTGEPAFSGATSATEAPFTSSVPPASTTVDTSSAAAGATSTGSSSSSTGGAWMPGPTGAIGAALGGLALIMQL